MDWIDLSLSDLFDRTKINDAGGQAGIADAGADHRRDRVPAEKGDIPGGPGGAADATAAALKAIKFVAPK